MTAAKERYSSWLGFPLLAMVLVLCCSSAIVACRSDVLMKHDGVARPEDIEHARSDRYHGPLCIAVFCFNNTAMTDADVLHSYGAGWNPHGAGYPIHCYKAIDQHAFVQVTGNDTPPNSVVSVFVSADANCPNALEPRRPFERLATPEGLTIGTAYDRVVELFGKPDLMRGPDAYDLVDVKPELAKGSHYFGDMVLIYDKGPDDLLNARIFIRNGYVSAFQISVSE